MPFDRSTLPTPVYPNVATWMPDGEEQFTLIAEGLLQVALHTLGLFPTGAPAGQPQTRAERFKRVMVTHGQKPPINSDKMRELVVAAQYVFIGRAGEENYQYLKGSVGIAGFVTARYVIQLAEPWVMPTGGYAPAPARSDRIAQAADELYTDAYIVWSSMVALMLGGISPRPWPTKSERGEQIMVGPLTAVDPAGNMAGWSIEVQVQTS